MTESDQTRESDQDCCEISYIITSGRFGTPAEGLLRQDETHVEFIGVVIDPEVMEGVYEYALEAAMRTLNKALKDGPDLGPAPGAEPSTVDEDEDYMPSTAEVRAKFAACAGEFSDIAGEDFDRWVAEVKAEARREGLARGFDEGWVAALIAPDSTARRQRRHPGQDSIRTGGARISGTRTGIGP